SLLQGLAILEKHGPRGLESTQVLADQGQMMGKTGVHYEALVRQFSSRQEHLSKFSSAIMLNRILVGRQRAWHAAGQRAGLAELGMEPKRWLPGAWLRTGKSALKRRDTLFIGPPMPLWIVKDQPIRY